MRRPENCACYPIVRTAELSRSYIKADPLRGSARAGLRPSGPTRRGRAAHCMGPATGKRSDFDERVCQALLKRSKYRMADGLDAPSH